MPPSEQHSDLRQPELLPGPATTSATVLRVDRTAALLDLPGGPVSADLGTVVLAQAAADPSRRPCTGDVVDWERTSDGRAVVTAVHPRRSLLVRAAASGVSQQQLLAANVDLVAVVEGLWPDYEPRRIDRLLTLAWGSGAEPVVLLTKADLVPDAGALAAELAAHTACRVVPVSVLTGQGLDDVRGCLAGGRVMALLGASGAGKSSLLNALAGEVSMPVGELRRDGKGRHTTVTRELHPVAGGAVIDGPGLRGVALVGIEGLDRTFADVLAFAGSCRFADCGHDREPGCAVQEAVAAGDLDPERLFGWRKLIAEARRQELRQDARLRSENRKRERSFHKELRTINRTNPRNRR